MTLQSDRDIAGESLPPANKPATTEFAAGAVFLTIALVAAWSLWTDPYLAFGEAGGDPGAAFIPWLGTAILGFGGLAQMIWTALRARRSGGVRTSQEFLLSKLGVPVVLVVLLILYRFGMSSLGFVTASLLFVIPVISVLHWRSGGVFSRRYLVQLPVEAALIVAAVYLVFSYGIHVPFP